MNIINKMREKASDNGSFEGVTIAFLGDSVTQGCFELYKTGEHTIDTVFDKKHTYHRYLEDIFATLFPTVPVNIINAGVSGNGAGAGLARLERDVLRHQPDLTVVCFGLNDASNEDNLMPYLNNLEQIFCQLAQHGIETIFLTPNMMNTKISVHLQDEDMRKIAESKANVQNSGWLDRYIEGAKDLCRKHEIAVCDCYAIWKQLHENGVNTTELLANKINHPTRDMNFLFAYELVRTMFQ